MNLPSVKFGALFLNLAGSSEGGGTTDVFAYIFSALGDSGARSSSELLLCCPVFRVSWSHSTRIVLLNFIGSAISNLSVSECRL